MMSLSLLKRDQDIWKLRDIVLGKRVDELQHGRHGCCNGRQGRGALGFQLSPWAREEASNVTTMNSRFGSNAGVDQVGCVRSRGVRWLLWDPGPVRSVALVRPV